MKKIIVVVTLILAIQILASCQGGSNSPKRNNPISQKYSETYDGSADYLATTYNVTFTRRE